MKQAFKSQEWAASGKDLQSWGGMDLVTMFSAEPHQPARAADGD